MAMMMNIAGTTPVEDPEYRYKMPRLVGKVEGRGNGIKTAIPNMTSVAQALHRAPGEVTKFFGCELGAQTTWTEETERAIVNGAHTTQVLQDKLSVYIEKFVLCPSCKLPETSYKIKNEMIYHQCVACGAREAVDMQHKLTTFILKAYKLEKKQKDKGDKADKKEKKKNKAAAAAADKDKDGEPVDDEAGEKKKKKSSSKSSKSSKDKLKDMTEEERAERAERKRKKKAEKLAAEQAANGAAAAASNGDGEHDDDDDDDKDDDDDDDEESNILDDGAAMASALSGLKNYLAKGGHAPEDAVAEVRAVQTFCALPRNERAFMLVSANYDAAPDKLLVPPDAADAGLLAALRDDSGALALIGGLEKLVIDKGLAPKFAIVLKHLYDADVLDEQAVLDWHAKGPAGCDRAVDVSDDVTEEDRAVLLKHTEPFVTWLQEAEEDDDDDDDQDEED